MSELQGIGRFKFHEGKLEEFKRLSAQCMGDRADQGHRNAVLQRRAWQWALVNRRPDGSLPAGSEVARQFGRSERWRRLVTGPGRAGQLTAATETMTTQ